MQMKYILIWLFKEMVHMKNRIMKQVMYGVIYGVLNMLC